VRTLCELLDARLNARPEYRAAFPTSPTFNGSKAVQLISYVRDRLGHDRRYAIDYSKASRDLGYAPARNLEGGLGSTVDWYLQQVKWWQDLLGRDYAAWLRKNYDR
jgi:dTDP-glucose 4,6-dehydratase